MSILQPVPGYVHRAPGSSFSGAHQAVDIPAPAGTPVVAVADGVVAAAGQDSVSPYNLDLSESGAGLVVTLRHRATAPVGVGRFAAVGQRPAETQYAHLSRVAVSRGANVRAGQVIGYVGATGNATGPHLHFGLRIGGVWDDYRDYLAGGPDQAVKLHAEGVTLPAGAGGTPELALGEATPEAAPGTYPDLMGSGGGRCDVSQGWRDASALETFMRPELEGYCVRTSPESVAVGLIGPALDTMGDIARNGLLLLGLLALLIVGVIVLARGR